MSKMSGTKQTNNYYLIKIWLFLGYKQPCKAYNCFVLDVLDVLLASNLPNVTQRSSPKCKQTIIAVKDENWALTLDVDKTITWRLMRPQ